MVHSWLTPSPGFRYHDLRYTVVTDLREAVGGLK